MSVEAPWRAFLASDLRKIERVRACVCKVGKIMPVNIIRTLIGLNLSNRVVVN